MVYWNYDDDKFLNELRQKLPSIFTRETASQMMGGIFSPRTLSNFDAAGTGPPNKRHIGKKVVYSKDEFLQWLQGMIRYSNTPYNHNKNKYF